MTTMKKIPKTHGRVINQTTGKTSIAIYYIELWSTQEEQTQQKNEQQWQTLTLTTPHSASHSSVHTQNLASRLSRKCWKDPLTSMNKGLQPIRLPYLSESTAIAHTLTQAGQSNGERRTTSYNTLFFVLIRAGITATGKAHSIQLPYGQSEPAPMTAPVGCSVRRMGVLFSSCPWLSVNQHRTTVNVF
jgi:hypothetical protein